MTTPTRLSPMKASIIPIRPQGRPRAGFVDPAPATAPKRKYKVKGPQVGPDYAPEGDWKPLSNEQKARLALLAKQAARMQYLPESGPEHDAWRQERSLALAKVRISEARQRHWNDLHAVWQDMAGESGKAFAILMRADGNPRRVAMFKLTQELKARGLADKYAETICFSMFKVSLADASAKQLWKVLFTLRSHKPQ